MDEEESEKKINEEEEVQLNDEKKEVEENLSHNYIKEFKIFQIGN